jgi:hypothetical protein
MWRFGFLFCCLCGLYPTAVIAAPKSPLDPILADWVSQNILFQKDRQGHEALWLRKKPVRAYVQISDPETSELARAVIGDFAQAFGLDYEFTPVRTNLVMATADRIDDGGKPSKEFLTRFGITAAGEEDNLQDADWSSGCGILVSPEQNFSIGVSVGAGRRDLPTQQMRECIVTIVGASFGLRPIASGSKAIAFPGEYLQILMLAQATKACDDEFGLAGDSVSRNVAVTCIVDKLKSRISR